MLGVLRRMLVSLAAAIPIAACTTPPLPPSAEASRVPAIVADRALQSVTPRYLLYGNDPAVAAALAKWIDATLDDCAPRDGSAPFARGLVLAIDAIPEP